MKQRVTLIINYGTKHTNVPADIAAKLREDLLGTGVYVEVASLKNFESETGVIVAIADVATLDNFVGNPETAAQAALDKKYGKAQVPAEATEENDEEAEDENDKEDEPEAQGSGSERYTPVGAWTDAGDGTAPPQF